jgi:hypothetical protein
MYVGYNLGSISLSPCVACKILLVLSGLNSKPNAYKLLYL